MVYLICNAVKSHAQQYPLSHYTGEKNQEEDGEVGVAKAQILVLNNFLVSTSLSMQ